MLLRCVRTVPRLRTSSSAIWRLLLPRAATVSDVVVVQPAGVPADSGAFLLVDRHGATAGRAVFIPGTTGPDGAASDTVHDCAAHDVIADVYTQAAVAGTVAAVGITQAHRMLGY